MMRAREVRPRRARVSSKESGRSAADRMRRLMCQPAYASHMRHPPGTLLAFPVSHLRELTNTWSPTAGDGRKVRHTRATHLARQCAQLTCHARKLQAGRAGRTWRVVRRPGGSGSSAVMAVFGHEGAAQSSM